MTILVCPLSRVPSVARAHQVSHIVSLLSAGTPFPVVKEVGDRHLRVEVDDILDEAAGDALCEARLQRILDFVTAWPCERPMLIHCYAGISRSTATAFIGACARNPGVDEEEIAWELRGASPSAAPNRRFVALADAALKRDGRMSRAIERIGDGTSWFMSGEAAPFSIPSGY